MKKIISLIIVCILILSGCSNNQEDYGLNPDKPVEISIWHYYNGTQNNKFNGMVQSFNESVGLKEGIKVTASSLGSINEVGSQVMASLNKEEGAKKMPDIFSAYRDLGYDVNKKNAAVDLKKYLSEKELDYYNEDFIKEGMFDKQLLIFPTSKCSELLMLNKTDWLPFAKATNSTIRELSTWEGLLKVAKRYYEYTDDLTATLNDGSAFFGRDAFANYMYVGSEQLDSHLFSIENGKAKVTLDKKIIKKLWDHYYMPYVSGYFLSEGKFASDDAKTGDILSYVGSSSSASYFPKEVTIDDTQTHSIESIFLNAPQFTDGEKIVIQQGAGMMVAKSNKKQEYAATLFLKWFTQAKRNLEFSIDSGYVPVSKETTNEKNYQSMVKKLDGEYNRNVVAGNTQTIKQFAQNKAFVNDAFDHSFELRKVLETSMPNKAKEDRAIVVSRLDKGESLDEILVDYRKEDHFNKWFNEFETQLKECIQ
ncbi:MAG: extracellular solute-binding protein [Erysipelotrichaceae bacterium]